MEEKCNASLISRYSQASNYWVIDSNGNHETVCKFRWLFNKLSSIVTTHGCTPCILVKQLLWTVCQMQHADKNTKSGSCRLQVCSFIAREGRNQGGVKYHLINVLGSTKGYFWPKLKYILLISEHGVFLCSSSQRTARLLPTWICKIVNPDYITKTLKNITKKNVVQAATVKQRRYNLP